MNVDLGIWSKLNKCIIALLFVAALVGVFLWYQPLIKHNQQWRRRDLELDREIQRELKRADNLQRAIDGMADPKMIERLARERLGYAKPGETVVRFEAPSTNSAAGRP